MDDASRQAEVERVMCQEPCFFHFSHPRHVLMAKNPSAPGADLKESAPCYDDKMDRFLHGRERETHEVQKPRQIMRQNVSRKTSEHASQRYYGHEFWQRCAFISDGRQLLVS